MAQAERTVIAPCPNPKCGKPVWSDHSDGWCHKCGEYLPEEFVAKLPRLVAHQASAKSSPSEYESIGKAMEIASPRARAAMGRYRDAYRVANVVVTAGDAIKVVGFTLAVLIALIGVVVASKIGMLSLLAGLIPAATIGLLSWLGGVLLSAQGQLLLASLDSVVGISPFLTDEERAEVMRLP